ncbi:Gfo/Idh/MocA family protein [Novosphingobium jiangmenense]|uniref:Gfo/Idh/MocA family oxidoreductase n=1 Tax=Novosphingobium jiangmenense TaxID=2791981 RepID=A0ABS0HC99_9SPHN|nr:Gfo/Idh/MocA family oxidoreductase [Novosphingobium jiangmenense]MBF9149847.1 Gfo/Idh/MocA family oxidoreductase [Novosphingobium jiangmenense]
MNASTIGAVVVGTGFGLFTHVRALRDAGFEVRAIVGRDLEKTRARAAPLGIPLASNDLPQVLADDPAIRLVTVATPPHAHYTPVMQAIAAGRAVMCEKPFARDTAQAREMLAAAEAAGVPHALGAEFRYDSAQALLSRLVRAGAIGEPLMFHRIYQQPGGDPTEPLADWWTDAAQGGGFLGAFGTHMIDQARATVGEITAVSAILRKLSPLRPAMTSDDYYNVQFRTASGCMGVLEAAMCFPGPFVMTCKVAGTKGAAWIQSGAVFGDPEQVWVQDAEGKARQVEMPAELVNPAPEPFPIGELVQTEMDRWHSQGFDVAPYAKLFGQLKARIAGTAPPLPDPAADFRDALANQAILDAARRSAAELRWVEVEQA